MRLLNLGCGITYHSSWVNVDLYPTGSDIIPCDLRYYVPFVDNSFDAVYHSHLLEHFSMNQGILFMKECFRVLKPGGIIRVVVPDLEQIVRCYLNLLDNAEKGEDDIHDRYTWILLEMFDQMVRNEPGGNMCHFCAKDSTSNMAYILERCGSEFLEKISNKRERNISELSLKRDFVSSELEDTQLLAIGKFRVSGETHQWMYDRYSLKVLLQQVGFEKIKPCKADESDIPNFGNYNLDITSGGALRKPDSLFFEAYKSISCQEFKSKISDTNIKTLNTEKENKDNIKNTTNNSIKLLFEAIQKCNIKIDDQNIKLELLKQDRDNAVEEIKIRDAALSELKQDRDKAVDEITIRDARLSALQLDRDEAVREIQVRDNNIAELVKDRDNLLQEIELKNRKITDLSQAIVKMCEVLPLVSIITPVFNCERWIEECIQSVLIQDYPKIEHIIIDGGSTDGTLEICQKYSHLQVHSKEDRGQSHAINKGFAMAHGEIFAWLCGDDLLEPNGIWAAVKGILSGKDIVMGYSRFIDANGNFISEHPANIHPYYDHTMFVQFWKFNPISQPATFWTREIWENYGPLNESLYFAMDYDFWLRISKRFIFYRLDSYTAKYRIHPDAKCFADNYGSRIELIKVSKQYWPAIWRIDFWKLYIGYLISRNGITQHFSDGERLLEETLQHIDNSDRKMAFYAFLKAHLAHLPIPTLPAYKFTLKRILKEVIGPEWFWRLGKKAWYFIRRQQPNVH